MTTITVNGIDFNVEIDTGFGEIEVTDINGNKVAFAEIDQNMEQGSYTVFDEDGEGEELPLPREIYNDLADGDGAEAAYWLCAISFD
jgi:hypothetical protein